MEVAGRQAQCPNCGGPIEWKLGSSAALVCPWCSSTIVRTDRDLQAVGRVADLVPTAPVMAVGDLGKIGEEGFTVGGRIQLDHGKGPWDEWYVEFHGNRWGWLAKAQGNWYLTFLTQTAGLPTYDQMTPGQSGVLPGGGDTPWTVTERGQSQVVSAQGELPFPVSSGEQGFYVDLQGPGGKFATIDYGDGREAPKFFVGAQYASDQISWKEGGMGPRPVEKVDVSRLRCPSCGSPVPILVPEETERAACGSCNGLLDFQQGDLTYLGQLNQPQIKPWVPLGTEGTIEGEQVLCIGFMERCTVVEGITYAWREYLLHADAGYRWLLEDSGHFTYLKPISPADVNVSGQTASLKGRKHKLFSVTQATVRFVIGEFYWKVEVGERTEAVDYIAPPYILSEERSRGEVHWSAGKYMPGADVFRAFGLTGSPPVPHDVAPAQPNPVGLGFSLVASTIFLAVLLGVFLVTKKDHTPVVLVDGPVAVPTMAEASLSSSRSGIAIAPATPASSGPSVNVSFTPPFTLPPGEDTLQVAITSNLGHGWMGIACALINEGDGRMHEFVLEQDRFHESLAAVDAGGLTSTETVGGLEPGQYVLRLDPRWARKAGSVGATTPPAANIRLSTHNSRDSTGCCGFAGLLLFLPVPLTWIRRRLFEGRRWRNSNVR